MVLENVAPFATEFEDGPLVRLRCSPSGPNGPSSSVPSWAFLKLDTGIGESGVNKDIICRRNQLSQSRRTFLKAA